MADFSAIKTEIQTNIDTNGNQEITGAILQDTLLGMVDATEDNITELESKTLDINLRFVDGSINEVFDELYFFEKYDYGLINKIEVIVGSYYTIKFAQDNQYLLSLEIPRTADYLLPIKDQTDNVIGYGLVNMSSPLLNISTIYDTKVLNPSFSANNSPIIKEMLDSINKDWTSSIAVNSLLNEIYITDRAYQDIIIGVAVIDYENYSDIRFISNTNSYVLNILGVSENGVYKVMSTQNQVVGYAVVRSDSAYFGDLARGRTHNIKLQLNNACFDLDESPNIKGVINQRVQFSNNDNFNSLFREFVWLDTTLLTDVNAFVVLGYGTHANIKFVTNTNSYVGNIKVDNTSSNKDIITITNTDGSGVLGYAILDVANSNYDDIIDSSVTIRESLSLNYNNIDLVSNPYIAIHLETKSTTKKNIVCFGDSITQMGYPEQLAILTGHNVINAGIGGTRLANTIVEGLTQEQVTKLSVHNMIHYFCTNNWEIANEAAQIWEENTGTDIPSRLVDIQETYIQDVDYVIIMAGTNDINVTTPGEIDSQDAMTLYGALNSAIAELMLTNPNIQVLLLSPTPEQFGSGSQINDINYFSDFYVGAQGITKLEMAENFAKIAKRNHIAFGDMYNDLGCNFYNLIAYFNVGDYVHPRKAIGKMAKIVKTYLTTKMY